MAGQPNRRAPEDVPPTDLTGKAKRVGHGVPGSHEIDAFWVDTDDPRILKDRIRRYKAQVEKVKRDRSELKVALKLKTEEAYNEGLLASAPKLLEIDTKVTELANKILTRSSEGISEDDLKALKVLLAETTKQRDRLYGKTRQRVSTTSFSASADITEIMNRGRSAALAGVGDDAPIDVEPLGEETETIE